VWNAFEAYVDACLRMGRDPWVGVPEMSNGDVETGVVSIVGAELAWDRRGRGSPVVLVNGIPGLRDMWDEQLAALAADYEVIRYDLRGQGDSVLTEEVPYAHHEDLRALIDALGYEQVTLVGISRGGAIALDYAVCWPDQVTALVCVDGAVDGIDGVGDHPAAQELAAVAEVGWNRETARGFATSAIFTASRRNERARRYLEGWIDAFDGWHFVHPELVRRVEPSTYERLGDISSPTLVVVGALDADWFIKTAEVILERVPNAELVRIEGVGHLPTLEAPEALNAAALGFLERVLS